MATETFGSEMIPAPRKQGRAPLTLHGKTLGPKAWVKLTLQGDAADEYNAYMAAGKALREKFLTGLKAKHLASDKAGKFGIMLSMKNEAGPSYVICDKAAAGSTEGFSF